MAYFTGLVEASPTYAVYQAGERSGSDNPGPPDQPGEAQQNHSCKRRRESQGDAGGDGKTPTRDGSGNGDSGDGGNGNGEDGTGETSTQGEARSSSAHRVACPFYKYDPQTYGQAKWKNCVHGFQNVSRVKSAFVTIRVRWI